MTIDRLEQTLLKKLRNRFQEEAVFKQGFDSNDKTNMPGVPTGHLQLVALHTGPLHFGSNHPLGARDTFVQAEFLLHLLEGREVYSMALSTFLKKVEEELQTGGEEFACVNIRAGKLQFDKTFHLKALPLGFQVYTICRGEETI